VLETLSHQHLESIFPAEWICRKVEYDYGLDMRVEIVTGGEVTGRDFLVQLKATDHLKTSGDYVHHHCKVSTAQYFLRRPELVMYVVYDAQKEVAYWLWMQPYIHELGKKRPDWRNDKAVQIHIPCANQLTPEVIPSITSYVQAWWWAKEETAIALELAPHQLPPPPPDFIGREAELTELTAPIEKDGAIMLGIYGPGGIGKTALALKLAERLVPRYPDAQFFLDLEGTSPMPLSSTDATAHIIRAYDPSYRKPQSESELRGRYRSLLHNKRALILMDNARDAEQIEMLIPPVGCLLLVTSRQRFTLPGLYPLNLHTLQLNEACALLLRIAARIQGFADEIARLCGYLPLALRLAANAMVERIDLSPVEYVRRLTDTRQRLNLTGVEASLSLSYDLLSPRLQRLWCKLSVLPSGVPARGISSKEATPDDVERSRLRNTFDREAAAAVWNLDLDSASDALSELVRYSMVDYVAPHSDASSADDGGRYRLHDLALLFAEFRLSKADLADAQRRYVNYETALLNAIIEEHAPRVRIIIYRIIEDYGEWEDVEELAQDVFVKVWSGRDKYDPSRGSFATWVNMLARYGALDFRRRAARRARLLQSLENAHEVAHEAKMIDSMASGFAEMEKRQQEQVLKAALEDLPERDAQLITWHYLDGMTYAEIAELIHCPMGTVKSRIRRALKKLRLLIYSSS